MGKNSSRLPDFQYIKVPGNLADSERIMLSARVAKLWRDYGIWLRYQQLKRDTDDSDTSICEDIGVEFDVSNVLVRGIVLVKLGRKQWTPKKRNRGLLEYMLKQE